MKVYSTQNIRNVVLLGSTKSGKTTLSEAMLYEGKVIDRRGTVEAKNTVSDNTEIEQMNQRDDVREVATGYECGIGLENYNDIKENDVVECFVMEEIER